MTRTSTAMCLKSTANLVLRRVFSGALFAALVFNGVPGAHAVPPIFDDFSDGNDTANPTWTHLDGLVGSFGQTWTVSSGAYNLYAPSDGFNNYGSVGSHVNSNFTNVRVSMDLTDFHTTFAPGTPGPSFIRILARSNGSNEFLGLTGYGYGYDPLADAGEGEMVLFRYDVNDPDKDIGAQRVHLDETKDYRLVLEVIGTFLHGQVYNLTDGGLLIGEAFKNVVGQPFVYTEGTSGVLGYSQSPFETVFTIDNFRSEEAVPGDYNRNGATDAADYVIWRKTLGQQSPQLDPVTFKVVSLGMMDANGDVSGSCSFNTSNCEVIDNADLGVWTTNFGRTVSGGAGGAGSVPEPTSGALLLLGIASAFFARGRAGRQA